jgi:outer membrane protein TolC
MPLNLETNAHSREGWRQEKIVAELSFDRKLFEQENDWKSLNEDLNEAKTRLELALKLEEIQQSKLNIERERLQKGRSTTYQVLLFEQDYLSSQSNRIRSQAQILTLIAQMKLFGEIL